MVFGNMGETSATGVAFTRNPSTGEKELYGEFLINAQGEDVVAGIRTPQDITEKARAWRRAPTSPRWNARCPRPTRELVRIYGILEKHYRDMQDMEFTVERASSGCCRRATASAPRKAALRIAVDLASEGLITQDEAVQRVDPGQPRPAPASDHRPRRPSARSSPPACRPRPARRRRDRVQLRRGGGGAKKATAARSSSCASRPRPRTSTACTRRRAS